METKGMIHTNARVAGDVFLRYKDVLFWVFFTLLGLSVGLVYLRAASADIILPVVVIAMGISKLGEEMVSKSINRRQEEINRHLNDVSKWLENNYDYVMKMRDSHEKSISSIGDDHVKFDMKIERSYRELASKILDVENRLSRIEKGAGAGRFQQANSGKKRR